VVLAAGGAALEMGAHPRHGGLGVRAGDLELDVAVERAPAEWPFLPRAVRSGRV